MSSKKLSVQCCNYQLSCPILGRIGIRLDRYRTSTQLFLVARLFRYHYVKGGGGAAIVTLPQNPGSATAGFLNRK